MKHYDKWSILITLLAIVIFGISASITWTSPEFTDFQKIVIVLLTGVFSGVVVLARLVLAGIDQIFEEFADPKVRFVTIHNKEKK